MLCCYTFWILSDRANEEYNKFGRVRPSVHPFVPFPLLNKLTFDLDFLRVYESSVRFSFFSTKPRDWLRRTSQK